MREEFIRELTESVTQKKGNCSFRVWGFMHSEFDEFIHRVKHGLYRGFDEFGACYFLLTHSTNLLKLYYRTVLDAESVHPSDKLFEDNLCKFLAGLNSEFFNMFRIRSFEKFVSAMFSVAEYDVVFSGSNAAPPEYGVSSCSASGGNRGRLEMLLAEALAPRQFHSASVHPPVVWNNEVVDKHYETFKASCNLFGYVKPWLRKQAFFVDFPSELPADGLVTCEDNMKLKPGPVVSDSSRGVEYYNSHFIGAEFVFPDEAAISIQPPVFEPWDKVLKGIFRMGKDLQLHIKSLKGSCFHNRRVMVRAQRQHWKALKGGVE